MILPGFVHGHQLQQEIIWITPKIFKKLLIRLAPLRFFIRIEAFRDPLRRELLHVQIFMNDGPTPLTWDAQLLSYLAEIWQSSKISSWIWSIITGVVTVLGRPGWGASEVEKSPRLNWATQFLTAYDSACFPNVSVRMAWISFGALPCRKKKLMSPCWNHTRCLTCFLSTSVTRKDLQFGAWMDPFFQWRYRFCPMTSGSRLGQGLDSTHCSVPCWSVFLLVPYVWDKWNFHFHCAFYQHMSLWGVDWYILWEWKNKIGNICVT